MSMTEPEFRALLDRYLNGNASSEERKLLDQFFDSYRDQHPNIADINAGVKEEILNDLRKKTDAGIKIIPIRRRGVWLAVAASVSIVIVAGYFLFNRYSSTTTDSAIAIRTIEYNTIRGQKAQVELPDGTRVKLNSNSHISYPEKFDSDTREVSLKGEAYFDVTHDAAKPFIVHSGETSTRVLGTSFNVNANTSAVTVTLVHGKVNVSTATHNTTLSPNQQATVISGSKNINTKNVDVSGYTAWADNRLIFEDMKLEEAFIILENWYNVDINITNEAIDDCVVTAKYENESLENVLNSFRFMLKIDYTINNRVVTITGKGCN
jgi:transmembrane sensor